jgi:hypothetical protein
MPSYGITITSTPRPTLQRLLTQIERKGYRDAVGEAGTKVLLEHFADKEENDPHKSADKLNAQKTGLYGDFGESTDYRVESDGVLLTVSHVAARQRYRGGRIVPTNAQRLTIPARAEAYGRRAGTVGIPLMFHFAFDERYQKWRPALVAFESGTRQVKDRRKGREGQMRTVVDKKRPAGTYFWLVSSVEQDPDPTVLPTERQIYNVVKPALQTWAQRLLRS